MSIDLLRIDQRLFVYVELLLHAAGCGQQAVQRNALPQVRGIIVEQVSNIKTCFMQKEDQMTTVATVLEKLRIRKTDNEFRWTPDGFTAGKGKTYQPDELLIVKTYRFEGMSDPADNSIIYIIRANDGLTGYSLDAYGAYSNHEDEEGYDNFIRQIPVEDHDDQLNEEI